ncbi:hypothetical protein AAFF_G00147470 [Aldrovandia affinis]|uniref:Uncharacterized protein n=1 Tax=Aldrovandia affinis TaxID=143900 RepID=A0AAD7R0U4_9TELE|nr:hypothetical protein AAFF_G00147470 [Aldrovandia affinis]
MQSKKESQRSHADERRGAKYSDVDIGDTVLVKQERLTNSQHHSTQRHTRCGGQSREQVVVESPTGSKIFKKHYMGKEIPSARETPAEEETPQGAEDSTPNDETPVAQAPEQSITNSEIPEDKDLKE